MENTPLAMTLKEKCHLDSIFLPQCSINQICPEKNKFIE